MPFRNQTLQKHPVTRWIARGLVLPLIVSLAMPPQLVMAEAARRTTVLNLPVPGTMVTLTPGFTPPLLKGITLHPENPFLFDFIVDKGQTEIPHDAMQGQVGKMAKYFLASLTVPEEDLWVNLSPYERDRIIPGGFGETEMGRDLLAQDYLLKQLAASLAYPEEELGRNFWQRIHRKMQAKFGTSEVPLNTFNKIWIVPDRAVVHEHGSSAFVVDSHLKVMIEEDYVALQKNLKVDDYGLEGLPHAAENGVSDDTSMILKEVLIPEIQKEINSGETFAKLRQIYHTLILATWFKNKVLNPDNQSYPKILGQVYFDQNKTSGIDVRDKQVNQKIFDQYVQSLHKGVYNYIKEEIDESSNTVVPRQYFSGGLGLQLSKTLQVRSVTGDVNPGDVYPNGSLKFTVGITDSAMLSNGNGNELFLNGWASRTGFVYFDDIRHPLIKSHPGLLGLVAGRRDMEEWHPERLDFLIKGGHFFRHVLREFDGLVSEEWEAMKQDIEAIQAKRISAARKDKQLFDYLARKIVELEAAGIADSDIDPNAVELAADAVQQSLAGPWQVRYRMLDADFQEGPIKTAQMELPTNWELAEGISNYDGSMQFTRDVIIPAEQDGKRQILRFEGVDYFAHVWVNGHFVGSHTGDFAPFEFDVTDVVNYGGINRIRVHVTSPRERQADLSDSFENFDHPFPNYKTIPKGTKGGHDQFHGGAWGPHAQDGNTGGIWGDVLLLSKNDVRFLSDNTKFTTLALKENAKDEVDADIELSVSLNNAKARKQAKVKVTVAPANFDGETYEMEQNVTLESGVNTIKFGDTLQGINPWTVWDQLDRDAEGPALYKITVETTVGQTVVDTMELTTGIRTVGVTDIGEPSGTSGKWVINGEEMFVRGLNYIPTYWVSEYSEKDYVKHLRLLKQAGLNTIYVHALVLPASFYRVADREGFMVIQMAPLQWSYDVEDAAFVERIKGTIGDMVDFVYNNPSVVGYVAHNEPDMRVGKVDNRALARELHQIIRARDPRRTAEAYSLVSGNHAYPSQFYDYHDHTAYSTLPGTGKQEDRPHHPNLITEYGLQAMADEDIFRKTFEYERVRKTLEWMRKNPWVSQQTRGEPWLVTQKRLYQIMQVMGGLEDKNIGNTFRESFAWETALETFDWRMIMDMHDLFKKREENNQALVDFENRPHRFSAQEEMAIIILDLMEYAALKRESITYSKWPRVRTLSEFVQATQRRQYRLHKDAAENYRNANAFGKTAGFVGFAAMDPAPHAYTWGVIAKGAVPKKAYSAYVESAQPVAVTLAKALLRPVKVPGEAWFGADGRGNQEDVLYPEDRPWVSSEIMVHNDTPRAVEGAKVTIWVEDAAGNQIQMENPDGRRIFEYTFDLDIPAKTSVNYFAQNPAARAQNPPSQWLVPEGTEPGVFHLKAEVTDKDGEVLSTNRYEFIVLEPRYKFLRDSTASTQLKIIDAVESLQGDIRDGKGFVIDQALAKFGEIEGSDPIVEDLQTAILEILSPAEKDRVLERYLSRMLDYIYDLKQRPRDDSALLSEEIQQDVRARYNDLRTSQTHVTTELLTSLAYQHYQREDDGTPERWGEFFLDYVRVHRYPQNYQEAGAEAVELIKSADFQGLSFDQQVLQMFLLSQRLKVRREWTLNFLRPGLDHPWSLREAWSQDLFEDHLRALVLSFDADLGQAFSAGDAAASIARPSVDEFLQRLAQHAGEGTDLHRTITVAADYVRDSAKAGRDILVEEPYAFAAKLMQRDIPEGMKVKEKMVRLRNAIVLVTSLNTMKEAAVYLRTAEDIIQRGPDKTRAQVAEGFLTLALARYKRLGAAQSFPEYLIEKHQSAYRMVEKLRREFGLETQPTEHLILTPTKERPWDLQRELLSIYHELQMYGYGKRVFVVIKEDSKKEAEKVQNRKIVEQFRKLGMNITYWDSDDINDYLDELNEKIFPEGDFDVRQVAGTTPAGSKGIHYGLFRNLILLMSMRKVAVEGIEQPIMTWVDDDNQTGAFVLTRDLRTDQRHVFNYFRQKDLLFSDPQVWIGGGGYTKDGIEGVEGFGIAWGWVGRIFSEAQQRNPEDSAYLPTAVDVTQYRPWEQHETLPLLLVDDERIQTYADQFLSHLRVLSGSFVGKFANQTQVYHPWIENTPNVSPDGVMIQTTRAFENMPGGNTSFRREVLFGGIPFFTGPGRGEDLHFNWLIQGKYGTAQGRNITYLTHTPLVHTRTTAGRHDIVGEIISSYNGRIVRESQVLWREINRAMGIEDTRTAAEVEEATVGFIAGMRQEAYGTIMSAIAYAKEVEKYVYDENFWWVKRAESDPVYRQELKVIRDRIKRLKSYESKLDAILSEQLLTLEDVKRESRGYAEVFPYWQRIVDYFRGELNMGAPQTAAPDRTRPLQAPDRSTYMQGDLVPQVQHYDPTTVAEVTQDVYDITPGDFDLDVTRKRFDMIMSMYRKWEYGQGNANTFINLRTRTRQLSKIYDEYVPKSEKSPGLWVRFVREALLLPYTEAAEGLTRIEETVRDNKGRLPESRLTLLREQYAISGDILNFILGSPFAPQIVTANLKKANSDGAVLAASPAVDDSVGGINLNPAMLDIEVTATGSGEPAPAIDFILPENAVTIEGFVPIIINVQPLPVQSLYPLMGYNTVPGSEPAEVPSLPDVDIGYLRDEYYLKQECEDLSTHV